MALVFGEDMFTDSMNTRSYALADLAFEGIYALRGIKVLLRSYTYWIHDKKKTFRAIERRRYVILVYYAAANQSIYPL